MPINYKKYPSNWKTEIRPRILKRANNKCEVCGVKNYEIIFRCMYNDKECYQTSEGYMYDASNSTLEDTNTIMAEIEPLGKNTAIKVILTIAHLDHDESNHDVKDDRLKAMCQQCHLRYDIKHKANKRKYKNNLKLDL